MKVYINSTSQDTLPTEAKKAAAKAADSIWDFQNAVVGDPALSDSLSSEDIDCLDKARVILSNYSK